MKKKKINAEEFDKAVTAILERYAGEAHRGVMSLLDGLQACKYFAELKHELFGEPGKNENDHLGIHVIEADSPEELREAMKNLFGEDIFKGD